MNANANAIDAANNNNLDINLLDMTPPPLRRGVNVEAPRARVGQEKYFREAMIYGSRFIAEDDEESELIAIRSYEHNCATIKVCDSKIVYPHAFEIWSHYGEDFFKTDQYEVVDLATGNRLPDWKYDQEANKLVQTTHDAPAGHCMYCKRKTSSYCRNLRCVEISEPYEGDLR